MTPTSFGIMTAPMQVGYHDVLRVRREADTIPEEHQDVGGRPADARLQAAHRLPPLAAEIVQPALHLLVVEPLPAELERCTTRAWPHTE
jgi:hypothetical protein